MMTRTNGKGDDVDADVTLRQPVRNVNLLLEVKRASMAETFWVPHS